MNITRFPSFMLAVLSITACNPKENLKVRNPLGETVKGLVFEIDPATLSRVPVKEGGLIALEGNKELPVQVISTEGTPSAVLVQADFAPNEEKELTLKKGSPSVFPAKTQAEISVKEGGEWIWVKKKSGKEQYEYVGGEWENAQSLRVDKRHTDHSFDIRYEGPGWESDKIGFRFYLDWRNANDLFGKKVDTLVLHQVGIDGFDSYHKLNPWGTDILMVGESLGIGSIGHWADSSAQRVAETDSLYSEVVYSGLLESKISTRYYGWKYRGGKTDLTADLSIRAGSWLTKAHLSASEQTDNFCTGIVKMDSTVVLSAPAAKSGWSYLATFGKQSLQNDHMGLFIFFRAKDLITTAADKYSYVVVLKPEGKELSYYFGGVWEQDASRIRTLDGFRSFLKQQQALLNATDTD